MTAAVRPFARILPPKAATVPELHRTIQELNRHLGIITDAIAELQGHRGTPTHRNHLDMDGHRVTNVAHAREDTDVPNLAQLRTHAMFAKDGKHQAEYLIEAKHGIRSLTPARADNDLITLGQLRAVLLAAGVNFTGGAALAASPLLAPNVTTLAQAVAFPQQTVVLANGANGALLIGDTVFVRLTGPTGAFTIGGFTGPVDGRHLIVYNTTAQTATFLNEDAATTATQRIHTGTGGDFTMTGPGTTQFLYSQADLRWIPL